MLLTTQADAFGRDAGNVGKEYDGSTKDERHQLVSACAFLEEHQHKACHQHACHDEIEPVLSKTVAADTVDGTYPIENKRRNGNEREVTVEPVVVPLAENRLRHTACQSHADESHHHPSHAAFRQFPFEDNL